MIVFFIFYNLPTLYPTSSTRSASDVTCFICRLRMPRRGTKTRHKATSTLTSPAPERRSPLSCICSTRVDGVVFVVGKGAAAGQERLPTEHAPNHKELKRTGTKSEVDPDKFNLLLQSATLETTCGLIHRRHENWTKKKKKEAGLQCQVKKKDSRENHKKAVVVVGKKCTQNDYQITEGRQIKEKRNTRRQ